MQVCINLDFFSELLNKPFQRQKVEEQLYFFFDNSNDEVLRYKKDSQETISLKL